MDEIIVRLSMRVDIYQRVEAAAQSAGLSPIEWIVVALQSYLEERADWGSINRRLASLDERVDLLDEVLSRLQRIEDRLDMID